LHKHLKPRFIVSLVLTFFPLQPRRKPSLPGGSAAKVFEPRPQKTKSKTARRGEFFAARPVGSVFGNSGMSGSPFLWSLSFGETKESD
jgi:hypothetical protein